MSLTMFRRFYAAFPGKRGMTLAELSKDGVFTCWKAAATMLRKKEVYLKCL